MKLLFEILPFIFAGIINASFVVPKKFIQSLSNERVWITHCVLGMMILPWFLLHFILPHFFYEYFSLPLKMSVFLIFAGFIFGLGQLCFAYAMDYIGIALSFSINLGVGVTIGSLYVVFYKNVLFTEHGAFIVASVGLIVLSLVLNYYSLDKESEKKFPLENLNKSELNLHKIGWLFAIFAGVASGFQNIAFITVTTQVSQLAAFNSFWVWPPFLFVAAIPMIIGFNRKKKETSSEQVRWKEIFFIFLMGLFYTGSLALYSIGMTSLTPKRQIIGWPLFMVSIVFVSQFWGWIFHEFKFESSQKIMVKVLSVFVLVCAFICIGFSL